MEAWYGNSVPAIKTPPPPPGLSLPVDELWMRSTGLPGIAEAARSNEKVGYTPKTENGSHTSPKVRQGGNGHTRITNG
eukprot:9319111-Lingulodinium_polyedra.AAC.1